MKKSFFYELWDLNLIFINISFMWEQIVMEFHWLLKPIGIIIIFYLFIKHLIFQIFLSPFMGARYIFKKIKNRINPMLY